MRPAARIVAVLLVLALALAGCSRAEKGDAGHPTDSSEEKEAPHDEHAPGHADEESNAGVLDFPLDAQKQAKLSVVALANRAMADAFVTTGEFEANADRTAHVTPVVAGRVTAVHKTVGDWVRAGDTLALLHSAPLGDAQASYLEALSRMAFSEEAAVRQRRLFAADLTARKDVTAAENALRMARIDLEKARQQLRSLGVSKEQMQKLARRLEIDPILPVVAPLSGRITARHATLGETIEPGAQDPAFVIVDTSELWVNANLYEKDLSRVRAGQEAEVTTPAYPGRPFRGKVTLISPVLDPETRTAKARIVVANSAGLLKPEMFANAAIRTGTRQALAVPAAAVMQEKGETYVFVQTTETSFEQRAVEVGPKAGAYYPVRSGLTAGERVVSEGAFTLKAELLKESFGEHEH